MPRPPAPGDAASSTPVTASAPALARAVDEVCTLAPDLGWAEATGLVEGVLDGLAHRLADAAGGRAEPTPLPLVVGAIGGSDHPPDHASCRAAAARLRALAPLLRSGGPAWQQQAADVMQALGELLDQVADRTRSGRLRPSDKGLVLRRLHALQRDLRADQEGVVVR